MRVKIEIDINIQNGVSDMTEKNLVRIVETELENFKNVKYGDIKFVNYSNAEYRAELKKSDIIRE